MPQNNKQTATSGTVDYDYIITGAGCAGLSFAVHLVHSGKFSNKKILIVDKDPKQKNDRTWCFWEKDEGLFQSIVCKEWKRLFFNSEAGATELDIEPYTYKLIRGLDFYNYCLEQIAAQSNITFLHATVDKIFSSADKTGIIAGGKMYSCRYIFNSILFEKPALAKSDIWMLQHFKGWFIHANDAVFDPDVATLMDFKTSQSEGTTFFYVLPFSATAALVEYTLFSNKILEDKTYEMALKGYVEKLPGIKGYEIVEKEFGVIPMTNYPFAPIENNIINMGTAGGQTKGSSGFTFRFIQKHAAALVKSMAVYGHPFHVMPSKKRFRFYDSVLLNVLNSGTLSGAAVFSHLFKKNKAEKVFQFLDNETTLAEDMPILNSLPALPFLKAAVKHVAGPFS